MGDWSFLEDGTTNTYLSFSSICMHTVDIGRGMYRGLMSIVLYSFEWLHFCEHRPDQCLVIHIFEALMECGRHNPVIMDPRSPEQKVVGRVGVNDIARHF